MTDPFISRPSRPARPRLTVTSPADLVAAVAVALGFVPADSLVMLVLAPSSGPHARIDLPEPEEGDAAVGTVARMLAAAAVRNDVDTVALVLFSDRDRASHVAPRLVEVMTSVGVEVAALAVADGDLCTALDAATGELPSRPDAEPYDVLSHRFVATAVADGVPVRASRDELEEMLRPDPAAVARAEAHTCSRCTTPRSMTPHSTTPHWPADVDLMRSLTRRGAAFPSSRDPHLISSLLTALESAAAHEDLSVRDAAWAWVERTEAARHVDLWVAVVRSADVGRAAQAASVLAFHAWLAGQGALAWCALDRVHEIGGTTSLATLVRDLLDRAVPPHAWSPRELLKHGDVATSVVSLTDATTTPRE